MPATPLGEQGKQRPDVSQTWDWPEAEAAVARCAASVLVTELLVEGWSAQDRVTALTRVLAALCRGDGCRWRCTGRTASGSAIRSVLEVDDLTGILNVRFFAVAGDDEAMVLDTLGLHVFGLPDLQCHFRGREPGEIAGLLYATAIYVFDEGDVIADGNTISGHRTRRALRLPAGDLPAGAEPAGDRCRSWSAVRGRDRASDEERWYQFDTIAIMAMTLRLD